MVQFFPWNCQSRIPHAKSHVRSTLLYLDEFLTTVYTCMRIEMQVGQRSCLSPTPIVSPCFLMHSFQTSSTSPFGSRWVKYCKGGPVSLCLSFLGLGRLNMQVVMFHFWMFLETDLGPSYITVFEIVWIWFI